MIKAIKQQIVAAMHKTENKHADSTIHWDFVSSDVCMQHNSEHADMICDIVEVFAASYDGGSVNQKHNEGYLSHWENEVFLWQYRPRGSHFDMGLVVLYSKADLSNRKRIAKGFPDLAVAFNNWQHSRGAFADPICNEASAADHATAAEIIDTLQDVQPEADEIERMQRVLN